MCYQGGLWPKEYHGKLFMGNLHGHRINVDVITPKGSGYVADRNPDFLKTNDKWSMLVNLRSGPDGNAFFNRPGPRLVESLEILAEILHPDAFTFGHEGTGWQRVEG